MDSSLEVPGSRIQSSLPLEGAGEQELPEVLALVEAWQRGERLTAADFLDCSPSLDDEVAIRLIYEEACLRREAGLALDTTEVVRRYDRWADELRALFACDRLVSLSLPPANFPEIGETLGPFLLIGELGSGASGRSFLATDPRLADRPVVLKVVSGEQDEHLALASLRHTHIVPLFSAHTFPERNLRALCMPFLGGTSLARIQEKLSHILLGERSGRRIVRLLSQGASAGTIPVPDGPFRRYLESLSYEQAILWIAACLADALHYAGARGVVHLDVKPSNVLITADGQPMLLDFHLARGPIDSGEWIAGGIGGTPGWMSPEQEAAVAAAREGRPAPASVDARSDLFSLGLILREALCLPGATFPAAGREHGPRVSVAVEDIVRRCLENDPRDRYSDGAALAEDLRRQLADLPLRGVRNRSMTERLGKWSRRHPGARAWAVSSLALLLVSVVALIAIRSAYLRHTGQIEMALEEVRRHREAGRWDEAIRLLEDARGNVATLRFSGWLSEAMNRELRQAHAGRIREEVHRLADLIRYRYGVELPPREEAMSLERLCRDIWSRRGEILRLETPPTHHESRSGIQDDLIEIAFIGVDLRVSLAPEGESSHSRSNALEFLSQIERELGTTTALQVRRSMLEEDNSATRHHPGSLPAARTPWEHYDLGRIQLRSGRIAEALGSFRHVLSVRPQDFWSNFYEGICCHRLRRFEDAVASFHACIALSPASAPCFYNRALARTELGRFALARSDYDRAISLDRGLSAALLNRGILSYKQSRIPEAIADFESGLRSHPDRTIAGLLHYNLAVVQIESGDRTSASAHIQKAIDLGCPSAIEAWGRSAEPEP